MSFDFSLRRAALAAAAALSLGACGGGGDDAVASSGVTPTPPAPTSVCSAAGLAASEASTAPVTVCMLTTHGEVVLALDPVKAPVTVDNFLKYVANKHYEGTLFHRVIKDFVIQGGGYAAAGSGFTTLGAPKTTAYPPIALESGNGLKNLRGTIGMARTAQPASATSQWYINTADNPCLDYANTCAGADTNGYAVFGQVIRGIEVVDQIRALGTYGNDQPRQDVVVYWVQRLK